MNTKESILPSGAATVTLEVEIDASPDTTWSTMIQEIGHWWRTDFLICKESLGMALEPTLGACFLKQAKAKARASCGVR